MIRDQAIREDEARWWRSALLKFALVQLGEMKADSVLDSKSEAVAQARFGGTPSMIMAAFAKPFRAEIDRLTKENEMLWELARSSDDAFHAVIVYQRIDPERLARWKFAIEELRTNYPDRFKEKP